MNVHPDFPAAALPSDQLSHADKVHVPSLGGPDGPPPATGSLGAPPPHPHTLALILSCAQTCALTLLAGFQLFYFQVMGKLWKRNQTGLRRSIPPVPHAPCVSPRSPPGLPGHWQSPVCCLCPARGVSAAISEHQPQAEPKIDDSGNLYVIKQPWDLASATALAPGTWPRQCLQVQPHGGAGGSVSPAMPFLFLRELLNHFRCFKSGQRAERWTENRPKCKLLPGVFHNLLLPG